MPADGAMSKDDAVAIPRRTIAAGLGKTMWAPMLTSERYVDHTVQGVIALWPVYLAFPSLTTHTIVTDTPSARLPLPFVLASLFSSFFCDLGG